MPNLWFNAMNRKRNDSKLYENYVFYSIVKKRDSLCPQVYLLN